MGLEMGTSPLTSFYQVIYHEKASKSKNLNFLRSRMNKEKRNTIMEVCFKEVLLYLYFLRLNSLFERFFEQFIKQIFCAPKPLLIASGKIVQKGKSNTNDLTRKLVVHKSACMENIVRFVRTVGEYSFETEVLNIAKIEPVVSITTNVTEFLKRAVRLERERNRHTPNFAERINKFFFC